MKFNLLLLLFFNFKVRKSLSGDAVTRDTILAELVSSKSILYTLYFDKDRSQCAPFKLGNFQVSCMTLLAQFQRNSIHRSLYSFISHCAKEVYILLHLQFLCFGFSALFPYHICKRKRREIEDFEIPFPIFHSFFFCRIIFIP